jgi:epoxyqueuosine reductase
MSSDPTPEFDLPAYIKAQAREVGFDLVGFAAADTPETLQHFHDWLDAGYAGEMHYIEKRRAAYAHPSGILPVVKTVIMLGINYHTKVDADLNDPAIARVSQYAWGNLDYHHHIREKLKELSRRIDKQSPGHHLRSVIDTAPLLERDFARKAGLGWFGKNTLLLNRKVGSFFFLAALLTDLELPPDQPHVTDHCGTCTRCLEGCPTDAFVSPYVLDARKCISYLTIELRQQPIPLELRSGINNWILGCDVCQDVCPWNRKAPLSLDPDFQPQPNLVPLEAQELLLMPADIFELRFKKTPLSRPGRVGILRNAAIVLGNSHDPRFLPVLETALKEESPVIRGAIVWAMGQIATAAAQQILTALLTSEADPEVLQEIQLALTNCVEN